MRRSWMNGTIADAYGMYHDPHSRPGDTFVAPRARARRPTRRLQIDSTMTVASAARNVTALAADTMSSASWSFEMASKPASPSTASCHAERRLNRAMAPNRPAAAVTQNSTIAAVASPREPPPSTGATRTVAAGGVGAAPNGGGGGGVAAPNEPGGGGGGPAEGGGGGGM